MPKLTKQLIDSLKPSTKDVLVFDTDIKGFLCKTTTKGRKVYMLYYRTRDGKQHKPSIGVHGSITCEQARQIAKEWSALIVQGKDPVQNRKDIKTSLSVTELSELYLNNYAYDHKKDGSVKTDKVHLKNHILPKLGLLKLSHITKKHIGEFHSSLRSLPTTANRCLALLSKMFSLAEQWQLREDASTLCKHIKKYVENKRERFLTAEEIEKLSQVLKEVSINRTEPATSITAIRLLLLTGCRLSEILTLKWEYIDLYQHRINFPDSKTGKKTIYLSPFAIEVLTGIEKKLENPYVIYGAVEGRHLVNLRKAWCRIRARAGLDDVRIHDLRHSFASVGAASGLSLPIIGALLGHTQAQTTSRYTHLIGQPLKEATNLIGEKMKSIVGK